MEWIYLITLASMESKYEIINFNTYFIINDLYQFMIHFSVELSSMYDNYNVNNYNYNNDNNENRNLNNELKTNAYQSNGNPWRGKLSLISELGNYRANKFFCQVPTNYRLEWETFFRYFSHICCQKNDFNW